MSLQPQEKVALLKLARAALQSFLSTGSFFPREIPGSVFREKRGAFVTLETEQGHLRGCIGHLEADRPLDQVVQEMALQAAISDPRFPAVTSDELPHLKIEISVLSPFRQISDLSEIVVGEHGLLVVEGSRRGLLLPQVAVREGWNAETFLSHTCRKAGLPESASQSPDLKIYVFSAEIFSEEGEGILSR
ncbi:MAG: AmmeMemoRadiSam system protein A [Deltaproteobacteria bacterium]|nr:AmmeMemoRadiSam system protein A [Deltaproteobacteria bacterium]MBI2500928.1 AmmeMemoRadiSam system protein A [Deltaproteobacteria bacterium]